MSRSSTSSPRPGSGPLRASPPPQPGDSLIEHHRQSSRYTYRQLQNLRQGSTSTPFRVIAHVDLDAFYAQCEMVRLGTSRTTPLAVQQWDSLIAVNYPARDSGISRMISAGEAKKLCPGVVLQHVATFREGEGGRWAYRNDAFKNIGTDKVSLDPYRAESRKILQVMKEELARWNSALADEEGGGQVQMQPASLEKASIDEVFIDLSPLVFGVLLQRYPELRDGCLGEDRSASLSQRLPCPPTTALKWNAEDCLVDLNENETEVDDTDWDDIVMLIGSEIIRSVRAAVWDQLSYTCSAGVARNKMMAKLGSGCNKPNKQTVVRNRAVQNFLGGFKFTKIRMLGGKLGDQVAGHFGTEQVSDLLNVSLEQFRSKLDDDTAKWLYGIIRGEDRSEVNPRTQIKSMLSAKSFRPSINSTEQAEKWLHIFAADIYGRLIEDGMLERHGRRPKTVSLHHRQAAQVRSRQIPIPGSKQIDEAMLFDLGNTLLRQVVGDGCAWPCANLSLSIGGFEDGVIKNRAIDGFLLRGEQAKANMGSSTREPNPDVDKMPGEQSIKRRKIEENGITRFFTKTPTTEPTNSKEPGESLSENSSNMPATREHLPDETPPGFYPCSICNQSVLEDEKAEHDDWHLAKELESQERQAARNTGPRTSTTNTSANTRGRGGRGGRVKTERGQMRLNFG